METFSKKKATLLHTTKLVPEIQNIRKHNKNIKHTWLLSLHITRRNEKHRLHLSSSCDEL